VPHGSKRWLRSQTVTAVPLTSGGTAGKTEEEALDRYYKQRPGDRSAKQTLIFQWAGENERHGERSGKFINEIKR
jgi:hypothetical protein